VTSWWKISPGVMERLGYGWEELSSHYRRLVYASISGYGDSGPLRDQPAYDMIIQAASGAMSLWTFWARCGPAVYPITHPAFSDCDRTND
jgi:crotonobetainyl-CoA:carnitine CoA-transferase CaiB-like acyl-CoA transferase